RGARGLELARELVAADLAPAEKGPPERRGGGCRTFARRLARILELQQVAVVQLGGGRDDEVGKRRRVGVLGLGLERVDDRLEHERQAVAVAVVCRPREQLALTGGARGVVGPVPEQQLAPVRTGAARPRRVELESRQTRAVEWLESLGLERRQQPR